MVSQAEPTDSLAVRASSSVVSRATTSRHYRRHGRSHAGTSTYVPQNDFPVFTHSGDVEIIIKAGAKANRYLLHRLILSNCSGFFATSISQEWSRATEVGGSAGGELSRIGEESGSDVGRNEGGPRRRWRYELDGGPNNDDIPMLVPKPESSHSLFSADDTRPPPPVRNKPPSSNPSFFRSVANLSISSHSTPAPPQVTQEDQDLLNHYDNLFRIFYNHSPLLDSIDIATAYIQCKSLLTLADRYDALAVVGPRIDHHLLQFQSRLWKQIAKYPSSYLKLGYLSQSKTIFGEALIHVVGAWPAGERHIRNQLPDQVLEIIEDKVEDLRDMVGSVEGQLYRLTLLTARGERVNPGNAYADWLVVSLFRQWLAENTSPPPPTPQPTSRTPRHASGTNHTHHSRVSSVTITQHQQQPPPSTMSQNQQIGRTFKLLGSASHGAYLGHEDCKRFLKLTPEHYSREGMRRFERRMDEMKEMARRVVAPLMRCGLEGEGVAVGYLTCTRVEERDFVWL
ncbi:hypothetical protein DSL72_004036 [Monilinia vaccinii-corymbosi]|uniref:BTB domain-containing protein n=1 Tax=Monilinia vaccinii-corymbosi TaxID=61207 RepID=A0A8A3NYA3_9HELO|nr:hypothetical protein DSL72_004036 [Monilinia vaccinii-corymbosi]